MMGKWSSTLYNHDLSPRDILVEDERKRDQDQHVVVASRRRQARCREFFLVRERYNHRSIRGLSDRFVELEDGGPSSCRELPGNDVLLTVQKLSILVCYLLRLYSTKLYKEYQ
jgi:hypothetical protein